MNEIPLRTIESRDEVRELVHKFYGRIRQDELLGPIFNGHISEAKWPLHLEMLTDFWESNLFGVRKFTGRPLQKHLQVDRNMHYTISQEHFGRWLQLWFSTIDSLFEGDRAGMAKELARRIGHAQFMMMWNQKPEEVKRAGYDA
jgi:hemoglobin